MGRMIWRFLADRSGATAVEYGLIIAIIGGVLVVSLGILGGNIGGLFNSLANVISSRV